MPHLRNWAAIGPGIYFPLSEHLSIRIEGWPVRRGQVRDWPAEDGKGGKQVHLRFATFDPLKGLPKIPKELQAAADGKLWIVQCRQVVHQQARERLVRAGAVLLRYLPDDAYIVRLEPNAIKEVRRLPEVRWVGSYHPAYRLDPNVFPEPLERPWFGDKAPKKEGKGTRQVLVSLFERERGARDASRVIRDAGGKVVFQSERGSYLAADVPLARLATVAGSDAVCAIERRFEGFEDHQAPARDGKGMLTLTQIRELCGAETVRKEGGYEGLGVRVAFWDDHIRDDHIDLISRPLTVIGPTRRANANHGTAIASILCGEGRGDKRARGFLPLGGVIFAADRGSPANEDRYGLVERFVKDHRAALLSSSSSNWGGMPFVKHYDGGSQLLDDLVLKYDLLICQSIGNSTGSGNGNAGSWSKNALMVGGVDPRGSLRREDHRHGVYTSGPALDGRVKPDLAHFASRIFCADASSVRGYGPFAGTSCATPLTAGLCGLMTEMWADGVFGNLPPGKTVFDRKPHAATAKALMINSAYRYPIEGKEPVFTRFRQGWGMADVGRLYESRKRLFVVDQEAALRDREAIEYRLRVPEKESELRVTLAWTDPVGTTSAARALVNDLDLLVIDPDGKRYHGNHGLVEGNVSLAGGAADRINNVENVFLKEPRPGVWRVLVAAHRLAWDQRGARGGWSQDFGLVACGVEARPILPADWAE